MEDIYTDKSVVNGLRAWAEKGIVGRGILLDFHTWRPANNLKYEPFKTGSISLKYLRATAEAQGTEIKFGDILIIRSGYMAVYNMLANSEIQSYTRVNTPNLSGVEQSEEMLQWIWENFSAVAADHPSFECYPTNHRGAFARFFLPAGDALLAFDTEKLAEQCKKPGRWASLVTSEVYNVPGGV
ncbi:MAG: hypothetical protein M1835_001134, partial [Candelina submexicana]